MTVSTHSTIHRRFKAFVDWVAPDDNKVEDIKAQAEEIRNRIKPKAEAHGLVVAEMPYSGSFAKKTGLKRYKQGNSDVEGQDVDIAFVLEEKDTKGNSLGCQVQNFKRWLKESYPNSDIGETKSSATISFVSTKLRYDLVPLIKTNNADVQKLIRTDGQDRQSSVKKHVEFVVSRTRKSNDIQGVVKFNQCLRLVKWWKYEQQGKSGLFGNGKDDPKVPSFLLDLLCAKAYDECSVSMTYPETLARWFSFLADVVNNRRDVCFRDYSTKSASKGDAKWLVADPVDPENNVVANWGNDRINELGSWFETARAKMIQAIRKEGEKDDSGSMEALVTLFGTAFKNNSELQ